MSLFKRVSIFVMSFMYVYIGIKHFTSPQYFLNITPPQIPFKLFAVYFTGILEITGGFFLFFNKTRRFGAHTLIFLLIIVFPANIYLYVSELAQDLMGISKTQALVRMPFQIPLIILAYWHSQESSSKRFSLISCILFVPTLLYFISI